jgi:uncharacterized protein YjbJ (UPF0337 family)
MTVKWNRVSGNWTWWKDLIQQRWKKLTHVHLEAIAGRRDHLLECIQRVYGISRKESERQLRRWEDTLAHESDRTGPDLQNEPRESAQLNSRRYAKSPDRDSR